MNISKDSKLSKESTEDIQKLISSGKLKRTKIDDDIQQFLEDVQAKKNNQVRVALEDKEKRDKLLNATDANRRTALHFSAYHNNIEITNILLSYNADLNIKDFDGNTPMMTAIKVGNVAIAELLIEKGADINASNKEGFTPLQLAVLSNDKKMMKILLAKNVKISTEKSDNGSLLHASCGQTDMEIIKDLINKEPKLLNSLDGNDMTPLHIACAYGNKKLALELIQLGADVNASAVGGVTPLHIAADSGEEEVCKALVEKGATLKLDSEGITPLLLVKQKKNKTLEELLSKCTLDTESVKESANKKPNKRHDDRASPESLKKEGNKAFHAGDYELAAHWYQLAIDVEDVISETSRKGEPIAYMLYSNKSACNFNLKNYTEALQDADKCIELAPEWPKGYLRRSQALDALGRKEESEAATNKMNELVEKENK